MPEPSSPTLGSTALVEASMMLARCRSQSQIVGWMERTLEQSAGLTRFDLIWASASGERSLRAGPALLPPPSPAARLQMADGSVAVEGGSAYVPMIARGLLQGWIATAAAASVEPWLSAWAAHCASALISVDVVAVTRGPDRERMVIDAIARVVSSTLDLDLLLDRIATMVGELIDARGFYVALIDQQTQQLGIACLHVPEGNLRPDMHWALDEGLTGVIIRTGEPLATTDYLRECERRGITPLKPTGVAYARAWLGVPLLHQEQTLGVMVIMHDAAGVQFEASDVQLLSTVAYQAAAAVANAQLYGQTDEALRTHVHDLEDRNRQLAEMLRIGNTFRATFSVQQLGEMITESVQALVDSPRVLLGLVDAEQGRIRIRAGSGLSTDRTGQTAERSISLQQLTTWLMQARPTGTLSYQLGRHPWLPEFENVLVLAIHDSMGALIGAIFLETGGALPLAPGLMRTLEIVANQAGIALTNATLYLEQQQTVDRLTALNALSLTVSTGQLAEDEIITMAVAGAVGTTGGQGGGAVIAVDGRAPAHYQIDVQTVVQPDWLHQISRAGVEYIELVDDEVPVALRDEGIQRMLVVPLRGANIAVGTLWIGYVQSFSTRAERETAVLYAKMTGAVLENLYLAGAVRNAHDRMASILLSTREGMLLVGEDSRVSITNRAFGDLLGIDQNGLRNRTIVDISGDDSLGMLPEHVRASICSALQKVVEGASDVAEGELILPGATERHLTWNVLPVHAAARDNAGALLVMRDVTADRQMERLRQDLANMIVHDLRSPLTNMLVSVDLLLKPATGPLNERQQRILNIASNSTHLMLDLVNALLDIRRLEQRAVELQRRPIDLPGVAEAVTDLLERIAEDKAVRVTVDLDALPLVEADPEMIRRVLQNLVDNALKFSPPDTSVQIGGAVATRAMLPAGHPDGRWVIVEVRDQGTGIPEEYQQVIFQLFVQAPEGHGHGTGIGLSFCRLAVEAHGGRIWVESTPGQGSTFRFTLPEVAPREPVAVMRKKIPHPLTPS